MGLFPSLSTKPWVEGKPQADPQSAVIGGPFLKSINTYFKITDLHRINSPWNLLFKVYQTELEKVEKFDGFQDFISSFPFYRGKAKSREEEEDTVVGEFKVEDYFLVCQNFLENLCLLY